MLQYRQAMLIIQFDILFSCKHIHFQTLKLYFTALQTIRCVHTERGGTMVNNLVSYSRGPG
jgi:hypothetical protein